MSHPKPAACAAGFARMPMPEPLPTVLMLAPHGSTAVEQWVAAGRLAAASDLILRLKASERYDPIIVLTDEAEDAHALAAFGAVPWQRPTGEFHFGSVLADCLESHGFQKVAYFGGGSAPLLLEEELIRLANELSQAKPSTAITNNLHSSDWFLVNDTTPLGHYQEQLPADNPFGWVMSERSALQVMSEPPSAASRLDIDTPMDVALLLDHPAVGPHLSEFVKTLPGEIHKRVRSIRHLLRTPASSMTLIGRASSDVWQRLERGSQIWVRMVVEERGMVASQRLARGEVRSFVAEMINQLGPVRFIQQISEMTDGMLWDTRVWMAAALGWPEAGDRFASDLGNVDEIENTLLRDMTAAISESSIPILAGGYGVVSGGLYALLESMTAD